MTRNDEIDRWERELIRLHPEKKASRGLPPVLADQNTLWMHNEARQCRPSSKTMNDLAARYPRGIRFRVHQETVSLLVGKRTVFKPVIEMVADVKGKKRWVTYMWLDHEGTFAP